MAKPYQCRCCSFPTRSCCPEWWCRSSWTTPRAPLSMPPRQRERQTADRTAARGPIPVLRRTGLDRAGRTRRRRQRHRGRGARQHRAHIGAGASGPGRCAVGRGDRGHRTRPRRTTIALAAEYKKLLLVMLQRREAWQIVDFVNKLTDPSALADTAGYASYLTDVQKRQLLETPDVGERLRALIDWTSDHLAEVEVNDKIAEDVREGMEKTQKEFLLRQQLAAIRKELGEGEPDGSDDYRAASRPPTCPRRCARPRCARSASWSGPASRAPRAAGSAPGWTPCWTCRGTSRPRTRPT